MKPCKSSFFGPALGAMLAFSASVFGAQIVIINNDGPGEGFNDPTPAAPVGGNPGTTLGAQRLFAFEHAANIWGANLDSPQIIRVRAAFNPLPPNVLGSAGAVSVFSDFPAVGLYPGPQFPSTWYGSALADKLAGTDLDNTSPDIQTTFSSNFDFYLGVDNNHGSDPDLVAVLLHELAHGLGFQTFVDETTGANFGGLTDIYARNTLDLTIGKAWDQMTDAERQESTVNFGKVIWTGAEVTLGLPSVLQLGSPEVAVLLPSPAAGSFQFGSAAFGAQISDLAVPVQAEIVAAVDANEGVGFTTRDCCSSPSNAGALAGKIALIERGGCTFVVKAKNAQDAGAVGVMIYNQASNAAAGPPGLGGSDPTIVIPVVGLRRADGLKILANPGSIGFIGKDNTIRAGADPAGRARLFAPAPVQPGSSISHFDSIAFPNLLMEPSINDDLTHFVSAPYDLTKELLRDIGWFPDADLDGKADALDCEPNSDLRRTVVVGGCDSGVPNSLFVDGCTLSDKITHLKAASQNHGQFVSKVSALLNDLKKTGMITGAQKAAIESCVAKSK